MKIKIMLTGTPSQPLVRFSHELSAISHQLSKPLNHSQIIVATITKVDSHSTRCDLSAIKAEIAT
jgi:hypothetical protein